MSQFTDFLFGNEAIRHVDQQLEVAQDKKLARYESTVAWERFTIVAGILGIVVVITAIALFARGTREARVSGASVTGSRAGAYSTGTGSSSIKFFPTGSVELSNGQQPAFPFDGSKSFAAFDEAAAFAEDTVTKSYPNGANVWWVGGPSDTPSSTHALFLSKSAAESKSHDSDAPYLIAAVSVTVLGGLVAAAANVTSWRVLNHLTKA